MNVGQAIEVLNAHRHRDTDEWALNVHGEVAPQGSGLRMDYFTAFEAVAVAEALLNRGGDAAQESRLLGLLRRVEQAAKATGDYIGQDGQLIKEVRAAIGEAGARGGLAFRSHPWGEVNDD